MASNTAYATCHEVYGIAAISAKPPYGRKVVQNWEIHLRELARGFIPLMVPPVKVPVLLYYLYILLRL